MKAEPPEDLQPFRWKEIMKSHALLIHLSITFMLFWVGSWVFNHFPYPIIGIFNAVSYPLIQLYQFIKKRKEN